MKNNLTKQIAFASKKLSLRQTYALDFTKKYAVLITHLTHFANLASFNGLAVIEADGADPADASERIVEAVSHGRRRNRACSACACLDWAATPSLTIKPTKPPPNSPTIKRVARFRACAAVG